MLICKWSFISVTGNVEGLQRTTFFRTLKAPVAVSTSYTVVVASTTSFTNNVFPSSTSKTPLALGCEFGGDTLLQSTPESDAVQ